jgi:aminodeoxyfutalosine synthase
MTATAPDLSALSASHDIITIGMHAEEVRRRHHGLRTTFVRVADVTAETGAPIHVPPSAGEVRIVGTPTSRASALSRVAEVRTATTGRPLSAFALSDLEALSVREKVTLRSLLGELCAAGLELVAEAPVDALEDPRRAIEEVNIAGLALARLTVQHASTEDTVAAFKRVQALQRDVAVLRSFAPLPRRLNPAVPSTGYDDVKRVALARLVVDNIPSIQVDWALYGPKLAQVALTMGADDIDGVSAEDDGGEGRRRASLEDIQRNIRAAALEPVERNGRYELRTLTSR